eukprot:SAG31_NODE_5344_length_2595_cov_2.038061_2_plen_91_part_00
MQVLQTLLYGAHAPDDSAGGAEIPKEIGAATTHTIAIDNSISRVRRMCATARLIQQLRFMPLRRAHPAAGLIHQMIPPVAPKTRKKSEPL